MVSWKDPQRWSGWRPSPQPQGCAHRHGPGGQPALCPLRLHPPHGARFPRQHPQPPTPAASPPWPRGDVPAAPASVVGTPWGQATYRQGEPAPSRVPLGPTGQEAGGAQGSPAPSHPPLPRRHKAARGRERAVLRCWHPCPLVFNYRRKRSSRAAPAWRTRDTPPHSHGRCQRSPVLPSSRNPHRGDGGPGPGTAAVGTWRGTSPASPAWGHPTRAAGPRPGSRRRGGPVAVLAPVSAGLGAGQVPSPGGAPHRSSPWGPPASPRGQAAARARDAPLPVGPRPAAGRGHAGAATRDGGLRGTGGPRRKEGRDDERRPARPRAAGEGQPRRRGRGSGRPARYRSHVAVPAP